MRILNIVTVFLGLCVLHFANAQINHEITISSENTTVVNFRIAEEDTVTVVFTVNATILTFRTSTLHRIPFGLFTTGALRSFSAYNASISSLLASDFENADHLEYLYLSSNPVQQLSNHVFSNAPQLETVDLSFCSITQIEAESFSGLDNLKYLHLYGNGIATLPSNVFAQLPSLVKLDLGNNKLTDVSFAKFNSDYLNALWLENNQISCIDVDDIVSQSLEILYIHGNQISKLNNYVFRELPQLDYLNIGSNAIREIEEYAFEGLSSLTYLALYFNDLTAINPKAFLALTTLSGLDVSYNQINEISFQLFSTLQNVETLWIENNKLESLNIRKLIAMTSLSSLFLYGNNLKSLDLKDISHVLPKLTNIALNSNEFLCEDVADIIVNLRRSGITPSTYPNIIPVGQILLSDVTCYDYQQIDPIKSSQNEMVSSIELGQGEFLKLMKTVPYKETNAQDHIAGRLRQATPSIIQDMSK